MAGMFFGFGCRRVKTARCSSRWRVVSRIWTWRIGTKYPMRNMWVKTCKRQPIPIMPNGLSSWVFGTDKPLGSPVPGGAIYCVAWQRWLVCNLLDLWYVMQMQIFWSWMVMVFNKFVLGWTMQTLFFGDRRLLSSSRSSSGGGAVTSRWGRQIARTGGWFERKKERKTGCEIWAIHLS